ncbi:DUF456 domain-containing protein [Allomeiothermus silvanus]|uniref:DUF456 domain-containing protein n=1 Tax=Allomeiothermus silvanus TaxID=52022 RepID=UPI0023F07420|nr:DUF456 family protein [Allomeiothermus silvanus]
MNPLADWLFVVLWLVGVLGTFIPILPATLIILGAAFLHELLVRFSELSREVWIGLVVLTALVFLVDNLAGLLGARRYGASRAGIWGAFIGGLLGIFILPPLGLFVMPFVGAWVGEVVAGRPAEVALKAAWGTVVGMFAGMLGKFLIHVAMGILVLRAIF